MTRTTVMYYFALARDVARFTKKNGVNKDFLVGAVALRTDGVIVAARNGYSHQRNPCSHAEVRTLNKAGIGAVLFVVRLSKENGSFKLAKPCVSCQAFLKHKKVKRCLFTIDDNTFGEL